MVQNLNFSAFGKAEELKKRIWFTLGALLIYRLGTYIPLPGIDPVQLKQLIEQQQTGILGMFNMFSGGAVGRMAIFALNIMPYISASIIIQLMTTVSPHLEQLKKEGEQGRKQINQYTRYGTVVLAALQAYGIAVGLEGGGGVVIDHPQRNESPVDVVGALLLHIHHPTGGDPGPRSNRIPEEVKVRRRGVVGHLANLPDVDAVSDTGSTSNRCLTPDR